jgi:DNA-binding NarL/FixJ family response regulator
VVTDRLLRALREAPRPSPDSCSNHLMAGGYNNREIATALGVAEGTVENHVTNILPKMGGRDRIIAVLNALDSGYL